jgi:hypothetical protein
MYSATAVYIAAAVYSAATVYTATAVYSAAVYTARTASTASIASVTSTASVGTTAIGTATPSTGTRSWYGENERDGSESETRKRRRAETREQEEMPARVTRLMIVSTDIVSGIHFTKYMKGLRSRGMLGRMFVNECHTVIMDVRYRHELEKLRGLHQYECPTV